MVLFPASLLTKSLSWWLDKTPAHALYHFGGKLQRLLWEDPLPIQSPSESEEGYLEKQIKCIFSSVTYIAENKVC